MDKIIDNNDLLENENSPPAQNKSFELCFEYNVENNEEGRAFYIFQKKFVYKSNWIKTIAFALLSVIFIVSIVRNPKEMLNFILLAVCLGVIAITWINTKKIRKQLIDALKVLENDRYIFTLYADYFTIETILSGDDFEEDEEIPVIQPRVVKFSDIALNVIENEEMFVLILKKDTIYVLPKRCMTDSDVERLSKKFKTLLGDDYEKSTNDGEQ